MALEAIDYKSVSEMLDSIGREGVAQQLKVNPKDALSVQAEVKEYDYAAACSIIADLEAIKAAEERELQRQQKGGQAATEAAGGSAAAQRGEAISGAISGVGKGVAGTAVGLERAVSAMELEKKAAAINKDAQAAAGEIRRITGIAAKEFEAAMKKRAPKAAPKKLVLPTLSLQDQVNELRGISEGLLQNAFDAEQLAVIRDEIAGIDQARKAAKAPADESQSQLLALRDKLISDVKNRLLSASS